MKVLLDTHVVLWLLGSPDRIPASVLDTLGDRSTSLFVSAASAMEIATKVRIGKLDGAAGLVHAWSERIDEVDAQHLPISAEHAILAGSMSWDHRDPFDRLLVAQALRDNLTLVTVDAVVLGFPGIRALTW